MFCRHCGRPIDSDSKFCAYCGIPTGECGGDSGKDLPSMTEKSSGTAITALVCGILGLVFSLTIIAGIGLGTVALVLGLSVLKNGPEYGRGKAIAGMILGIFALAVGVLFLVLIIWGFSMIPDMNSMPIYTM